MTLPVGDSVKAEEDPSRRPLFPKDQIKSRVSLPGGAVASLEEPSGPQIKLTCTSRHVTWVSKLPEFNKGLPARIGSSKSPVNYVRCLLCGEMMKGGEIIS